VAESAAVSIEPLREQSAHVRRVTARHERIDLVWPENQCWTQVEHEAENFVESRRFERDNPGGEAGFEIAVITVYHDLWDADMDEARRLFTRRWSEDCPGLGSESWFEEQEPRPRVVLVHRCAEEDEPAAAADDVRIEGGTAGGTVLQLLLQGRDHFFMVELFSTGGFPPQGVLVRWVEFLKDVQPCIFEDPERPCPDLIWNY